MSTCAQIRSCTDANPTLECRAASANTQYSRNHVQKRRTSVQNYAYPLATRTLIGMRMAQLRPKATSRLLSETDRLVATEWRFAPGAETGWHRHARDYVVVVLTTGDLMQETANGEIVNKLASGQTYTRGAGVEHNVVNRGTVPMRFIEIELKAR